MLQGLSRCLVSLIALSVSVLGQTGTVDQVSPYSNASFNLDASSLTWQVQVRAAVAGQLEGIELGMSSVSSASFQLRVRAGAGWNTSPVLYETTVASSGTGPLYIDLQAAGLSLTPGTLFVVELQGNGTGAGAQGSYVAPPGLPLYSQPLFLNSPGCFADCGWRIGFRTFVRTAPPPVIAYCTAGTTTSGCTPSLQSVGQASASFATPFSIGAIQVEGQRTGILFYGLGALIQPWCSTGGSSFFCVKAPTQRTLSVNSGGVVGQCNGSVQLDWNAFHAANPGALGTPFFAGQKLFVQGWFRDPPACKTTVLTNAFELTLAP